MREPETNDNDDANYITEDEKRSVMIEYEALKAGTLETISWEELVAEIEADRALDR